MLWLRRKERGHLKADCPNQKKNEEIKKKKNFKKKKAYIAWDDDNETISDLSESDEEANISLVVNDDAGSQVKLVKCCYGDKRNSQLILGVSKEVFGRGSSSFMKYSEEVFILCEDLKEVQVHLLWYQERWFLNFYKLFLCDCNL
ncbi:hypothetical protein LR48_Vigan01g203900 [Vigna angularis]|uniref:Uncharacterized protein n=1 Tax=Phaseolus angularis TaxID=3914 RepID=A0A0L9TPJ9_PHAAN|nr:hypothetical protein LR48_Vigan01g203900 [Vigna angularis]